MQYQDLLAATRRTELTRLGITELKTPADVDAFVEQTRERTALVVINSMCGCAAVSMRPAVIRALGHPLRPQTMGSVFAGQDTDATTRLRAYLVGYPPSSPAVALMRDGKPIFMLERRHIQGRDPDEVAAALINAFETYCADDRGAAADGDGGAA